MDREYLRLLAVLGAIAMLGTGPVVAIAVEVDPLLPQATPAYPSGLLERLRTAATAVPGELPTALRYVTVAESRRPERLVLAGGSDEVYVQARTAFQLEYPQATIMIDSGMDEDVHRGFSTGTPEPYWPERNAAVQQALLAASLVVLTHEHGDHIAGVVRSPNRVAIAAHTVLTKDQLETLVLAPQSTEIRLLPEQAADYLVIDYALIYPAAPGVVLLKSPGHTPGHQMVYLRLQSGRELLLSGDVSWAMDGILEQRQRPEGTSDRIREDRAALALQLEWLRSVVDDGSVIVIPSHDADYLAELERRGVITQGLLTD
jgi:glyoxylase-like metal-dependent hydrolase (beta-lactamase superfamily II)